MRKLIATTSRLWYIYFIPLNKVSILLNIIICHIAHTSILIKKDITFSSSSE